MKKIGMHMIRTERINWKALGVSLIISLGTGMLAGILTKGNVGIYEELNKPPLSPPNWLFPIAWTILYILMGISAYLVYMSGGRKEEAFRIYILQLIVNFIWPLVFFNLGAYTLALIIIVILWYMVFITIKEFGKINELAAKLLIPYLIWVTYAAYLNLAIVILN